MSAPTGTGRQELEERIRELAPWYQNIEVAPGVFTKQVGSSDEISPEDVPAPLWARIAPKLGDLTGKRVLDIGCNAGYMSFECKRRGASYVLGIDSDFGAVTSFIEQARFCRDALRLDVDFESRSLFELDPAEPFDVVLFCGVLYHLENWADGLDRVRALVEPRSGRVILETAVAPVTETYYEGKSYLGDVGTFFVPSTRVLLALLEERRFRPQVVEDLGTRAIVIATVDEAPSRRNRLFGR